MSSIALVSDAVRGWLDRLGPGRFGVACSGGIDSIALADAAIAVAGADHVVVVTVDHGLAAGSAEVAAAVVAWARGQGATGEIRRVDVATGESLELAARIARYTAFEAIMRDLGLDVLLLGHTASDQAETVMMRIVRGTGPAGLAGIPARRGRYVRPLLGLDRATLAAYVETRGLPVWDDPMNQDDRIPRVRMRAQHLPALRRENPALDHALARLATSAAEWLEVIDERAVPLSQLPIDCARLSTEPAAIRKRALALALEGIGLGYDAAHLDALDELIRAPAAGERSLDVRGGRAIRSYNELSISVVGVGVGVGVGDSRSRSGTSNSASASPVPDSFADPGSPTLTPTPGHQLRVAQPGDRFRPQRLNGHSRKLSDLYIDARIARALRASARVLVRSSDDVIVWAEYLGIAFGEADPFSPLPT